MFRASGGPVWMDRTNAIIGARSCQCEHHNTHQSYALYKYCLEPKKERRAGDLVTCLNNLRGRNVIKFWEHWVGAYCCNRDLTLCFSVSFSFRLPQQTSGKIHKMYRTLRKSSG
jgi:hypothetical protein